jgi:hypothetical protein
VRSCSHVIGPPVAGIHPHLGLMSLVGPCQRPPRPTSLHSLDVRARYVVYSFTYLRTCISPKHSRYDIHTSPALVTPPILSPPDPAASDHFTSRSGATAHSAAPPRRLTVYLQLCLQNFPRHRMPLALRSLEETQPGIAFIASVAATC